MIASELIALQPLLALRTKEAQEACQKISNSMIKEGWFYFNENGQARALVMVGSLASLKVLLI